VIPETDRELLNCISTSRQRWAILDCYLAAQFGANIQKYWDDNLLQGAKNWSKKTNFWRKTCDSKLIIFFLSSRTEITQLG